MMTPWERFATVARGGQADRVPVAFIVDSPWIPGFFGVDTLDYFLQPELWFRLNMELFQRFPDVYWMPGVWPEYGMVAEPSAFGARIQWHHDQPPAIEPVLGGLAVLADVESPDPQQDGFMPLMLQRYLDAERRLQPEGIDIKMVGARGPLAVAGWLLGVTELMVALTEEREAVGRLLDTLTDNAINWLKAQLGVLRAPESIMLLDDLVGMLSPRLFEEQVRPRYSRIFDAFGDKIRVFHNDTPCPHLLEPMSTLGFQVFNFSQDMDMEEARQKMPGVVLMGNVPPLELMARGTPEEVEAWGRMCVRKTGGRGLILSAGGGMCPDTPASAVDALVRVAQG